MATDEGTTFSFERLDEDDAGRRLSVVFPKLVDGFVRSQPLGLFMPRTFQRDWPIYRNFALRPDDTWIVSFPKSGTAGSAYCRLETISLSFPLKHELGFPPSVKKIVWLVADSTGT